jgi:hypothetical protein
MGQLFGLMPLDITQFYTTEFEKNWTHVAQQKESRLMEAVTRDDFVGKRKWYNQLNTRTMQPVTTRKGDTPDGDTSGEKYWNYQQKYEDVISFDEDDDIQLGEIVLPDSAEVMNQAMALNRTADQVIIDAFFATRYTGEEGTVPDAFTGRDVAVDYVFSGAPANSGLTVPKLRRAKYLFDKAEVEDGERYIAVTSRQIDDLLADNQITSRDYSDLMALKDGKIDYFMGFKFKRLEGLPLTVATDVRAVPVWHKSALKFAMGRKNVHIDLRPDKRHAKQIRTVARLGAVRTENVKVVRIYCDESP